MYNQEVKERYLSETSLKYTTGIKNLFVASRSLEEGLDKDIAKFTAEEFSQFVTSWGFVEPESVRSRISDIAVYADWYCKEFGISDHHIREYTVDMFPYAKYFSPTVTKTPEELVQKILAVRELDSADTAMGLLCLAWFGIELADTLKLKKEQVDTKNGKIYDGSGDIQTIKMPECIRKVLAIYAKTNHAQRAKKDPFDVHADDLGYFIKRMATVNSKQRGKPITPKQAMAWILELKKDYNDATGENNQSLTYGNVQRSGGFYRLHELAKSGVDVRNVKNADKVRMCLGQSKRNHKDNMRMYDAYLEVIGEKV